VEVDGVDSSLFLNGSMLLLEASDSMATPSTWNPTNTWMTIRISVELSLVQLLASAIPMTRHIKGSWATRVDPSNHHRTMALAALIQSLLMLDHPVWSTCV